MSRRRWLQVRNHWKKYGDVSKTLFFGETKVRQSLTDHVFLDRPKVVLQVISMGVLSNYWLYTDEKPLILEVHGVEAKGRETD